MIHQFKNFITEEECKEWIQKSSKFINFQWENRVVDISNHEIVENVQKFIESKLRIKTKCSQAQIQLWPIDSFSNLHTHTYDGREGGDYNSLIYLNNNFDGGEFFTQYEVIKPEPGLLTFFHGGKIPHGVKTVKKFHRYTLIFWWEKTLLL